MPRRERAYREVKQILTESGQRWIAEEDIEDILKACGVREITDEDVIQAWAAYAEAHFRLKGFIPIELEGEAMRAALEAVWPT